MDVAFGFAMVVESFGMYMKEIYFKGCYVFYWFGLWKVNPGPHCIILEVSASGVLGRIAWQTFTYLWRRWNLHSHRSIVDVCCCKNMLNKFLNCFSGCSQLCRWSYWRPSIVCLSSLPLLWRTTTILWKPHKIQHTRTRLSTIWAWAMSTYASELNLDKHY